MCDFFHSACTFLRQTRDCRRTDDNEKWPRTHPRHERLCKRLQFDQLVACLVDACAAGWFFLGDVIDWANLGQNGIQRFGGPLFVEDVCDLPRSAASCDPSPVSLGRDFDEGIWNLCPERE